MSGELISVRALVISRLPADRALLRQGADRVEVPTEVLEAQNAADAAPMLAQGDIDLVLLDADLPAAEKASICQAARAVNNRPFVIAIGRASDGANVDASMEKPGNADEARSIVARCVSTRVPARIMVVDDSATMRSIVRKTLLASKFPLEIAEADEGVKALQELRKDKFDIVFLDYNMPGLNGFETLSELRREHPTLAVVIMTSTDNEAFAGRARQAGAAFLKKPFFPADIDAVLYRFYKLDLPRRA
jgi:DNA-binding response OmpR family regulator